VTWPAVPFADSYQVSVDGVASAWPTDTTSAFAFGDTVTHWFAVLAINVCGAGEISESIPEVEGAPPPAPEWLSISTDSCDFIRLVWEDMSSSEDGYIIYRDGILPDTVDADTENYEDGATVPGISYTYAVEAFNTCGNNISTEETGMRRDVPEQVMNFGADNDCGDITFTWTDVSDEDSYAIYIEENLLVELSENITEYVSLDHAPGEHSFTILAENECGQGLISEPVIVDIGSPMDQVEDVAASTDDCNQIAITWSDVEGELAYWLYRDFAETPFDSTIANTTTYVDTPMVGEHFYTIAASGPCGLGPESTEAIGERLSSPEPVSNCTASDTSCGSIHLTWTDTETESGYVIYRDGSWTPIDSLPANSVSYEDEGVEVGIHEYVVYAWNQCGIGGMVGDPVEGTRLTTPGVVPDFTTPITNCDIIQLVWSDVEGEDGYNIFRGDIPEPIVVLGADITEYSDSPGAGSFTYMIQAFNLCGLGPLTDPPIDATMFETPSQVQGVVATDNLCEAVEVSWQEVAEEIDSYNIYDEVGLLGSVVSGITVYTASPCEQGAHSFTVTAFNICGEGPASDPADGYCYTIPEAPTSVEATTEQCDSITVSWSAVTGDVDGYVVYRDESGIIGTTIETEYSDLEIDDLGEHEYQVAAFNPGCEEGVLSAVATGRLRELALFASELPDTVRCGQMITIQVDHCANIESDSVYLSLNNAAFEFVLALAPPVESFAFQAPVIDSRFTDHNQLLVVSSRSGRSDSLLSDEFVIECTQSYDPALVGLPDEYYLNQNYPNPFNASTTLEFGLPRESQISLLVYDILGREVERIVSGSLTAGNHSIVLNCSDYASGIYLIVMEGPDFHVVRKAMLMR